MLTSLACGRKQGCGLATGGFTQVIISEAEAQNLAKGERWGCFLTIAFLVAVVWFTLRLFS